MIMVKKLGWYIMSGIFGKHDFDFFLSIIESAGELAHSYQKKGFNIEEKADSTIVTEADFKVQELIVERISSNYPDVNFVHEENFDTSVNRINPDTLTVIIDPIDGTSVFSMYLPMWCISIGVFEGYNPLYGFVYSPGSGFLFYNDNDRAYLNGKELEAVYGTRVNTETSFFCASEISNMILPEFPGKIRNLGSTAMHACLTADNARNRSLAFIGQSYLWDWAGAIPVLLKAGVKLNHLNGEEPDYKKIAENGYYIPEPLIAHTAENFEDIKKYLKK